MAYITRKKISGITYYYAEQREWKDGKSKRKWQKYLGTVDNIINSCENQGSKPKLSLIHNRKSVRHFQPGDVSKEHLKELVRAGMAAPSARDLRPWQFLIITHEKTLKNLAEQLPYAKMLRDVPAAIVVLGDSTVKSPSGQSYWLQDTCAATENILLAAEALGLGAVWTALYPYEDRMNPVVEACHIPDHIVPLNIIPIGIPAGSDKPKDKWDPDKIHWNAWQTK